MWEHRMHKVLTLIKGKSLILRVGRVKMCGRCKTTVLMKIKSETFYPII